jgi:hypothetical protein
VEDEGGLFFDYLAHGCGEGCHSLFFSGISRLNQGL